MEKAQLAGLKRIDPNETKLSLAEVIEGYQNEKFQDMHIPVFRQEKNENQTSCNIGQAWYNFVNIRVEAIEYKD